jgi:hypothetical protein
MKTSNKPKTYAQRLASRLQQQLLHHEIDFTPTGVFKKSPLPDFYWDGKNWWFKAEDKQFYMMPAQSLEARLVDMGLSRGRGDRSPGEIEAATSFLQDRHSVNYAGPLAGYATGLHVQPGELSILVPNETRPVTAAPGEWTNLRRVIEGLLKNDDHDQTPYFYGWLKVFLTTYWATFNGTSKQPMPGQTIVLCGKRDCGKTLLKTVLIELFGGRVAAPYEHMLGQTVFNADLVEAPILEIDDEAASKDPRDRLKLAAEIKQFVANPRMRVHAKYMKPVTLTPCSRLIICVNDEPGNLMVLPMLEPSIEDKLTLFKARSVEMPMPTHTTELRTAFWNQLMSELLAFAHFLLNEFEIPEALRSGRFGVKHFHHPEILAAIGELETTEARVMEMIDEMFKYDSFYELERRTDPLAVPPRYIAEGEPFGDGTRKKPWIGTAAMFQAIISSRFKNRGTDLIFRYENSAGMLLRKLAMSYPERVKANSTVKGQTRWQILPPPE